MIIIDYSFTTVIIIMVFHGCGKISQAGYMQYHSAECKKLIFFYIYIYFFLGV